MFKLVKDEKMEKALEKTVQELDKLSTNHILRLPKLKWVDKTKPHLYFCEGEWHYRSATMAFDYINGPSELRNNSAMLWCWLRNQKRLDAEMQKVLDDNFLDLLITY